MSTAGIVIAIAATPAAGREMVLASSAELVAGVGIVGDRYATGRGTYSDGVSNGRALTLIESEALDAMEPESARISFQQSRRNVLTSGIDLNALVGKEFTVGGIRCYGDRLCDPCAYLERLTARPGAMRALVDRGGLRADVLEDGVIAVGDAVVPLGSDEGGSSRPSM